MEVVTVSVWLLQAALLVAIGVNTLDFNRGVIVHLFEWKYSDIARECEEFLAPQGFKGVQISPPSENLVLTGRPWYERYQPVSYKLTTRSGSREDMADMLKRCNKVGVRVFADVILNHMTANADSCHGTDNSSCAPDQFSYPAVPYSEENFHFPLCALEDYDNTTEVRVCELVGLHDLNQTQEYVREKLVDHMNELIDLGMAGLRIDAAKHIYPENLAVIYSRLHNLNTSQGFPSDTSPFLYQEVTRYGKVMPENYTSLAMVTEFYFGKALSRSFQGQIDLNRLKNFGSDWGMLPDSLSIVFIENHDGEREVATNLLSYKNPQPYKMAIAFMLAWPYGTPKIMSSYEFSDPNQGPPHDSSDQTLTQQPILGNTCSNGWVCQHRWRQVYNMVAFRNVVQGTEVQNWWDNGKNQIAFCRGNKGFIAFNLEATRNLSIKLQTCLPAGTYCDVISGVVWEDKCTGKSVQVSNDGTAQIFISNFDPNRQYDDGVLALHVEASLKNSCVVQ